MGTTVSTQVSIPVAAHAWTLYNTGVNHGFCVSQVIEPAEGIVTVNTQAASKASAEDSILRRLQQLPQVRPRP